MTLGDVAFINLVADGVATASKYNVVTLCLIRKCFCIFMQNNELYNTLIFR
jgi:hypothetical protein